MNSKNGMNFLDFPKNVQEKIYESLHVNDRVRLNIVLPRNNKMNITTNTNSSKDRKLGVLVKCLKNKKINQLSQPMMWFLKTVNENDPTTKDIIELFPDTKNIFSSKSYENELLTYKILHKTSLTDDDIDEITKFECKDIIDVLKRTSPEIFDKISKHPKGSEFMKTNIFCERYNASIDIGVFIFTLIANCNANLLQYIIDKLPEYGLSKESKSIQDFVLADFSVICIGEDSKCRKLLFQHFDISKDVLEKLYCHLVKLMDIDSALEIEQIIKSKM